MKTEAIDSDGNKIVVEIEDDKVNQLYEEFKSRGRPKRELNRMIANLEISADAKALIKSIMDAVIKVGDVVLRIGKRIVEIVFDIVKRFPNATFGLVMGVILSVLIASIPIIGAILAPFLAPVVIAFGLVVGFMEDMSGNPIVQAVKDATASLVPLKGTI